MAAGNANRKKNSGTTYVFVLEDDQALLSDLGRLIVGEHWEMISAGSFESAVRTAKENSGRAVVALVDIMIPANEKDLHEVNKLLETRESKISGWTEDGQTTDFSLEQLKSFRDDLQIIDKKIASLIQIDGGLSFLKFLNSSDDFQNWKIVVFSARDTEEPGLRSAVQDALGKRELVAWLSKPISPYDLVRLLRSTISGEA